MLPTLTALEDAAETIHRVLPPTPQIHWPLLCERTGAEVWVKHENHQPVGAFKVRGGLLYMDELKRSNPDLSHVIAATRGNHGQSIAFGAGRVGIASTIVVPHGNSREKNAAMRALGAELIEHGDDFQEALEFAMALAEERNYFPTPSFEEPLVRGVGTCSLEFLRARPDLKSVYVPIGLGSGICGMAAAREALGHKAEIVGIVSTAAPAYALSFEQHEFVVHPTTTRIADGMACSTPNAEALELIWRHVDRVVQVTDQEIEAAMRALFTDTHNVAEGAGAAGLAAILQERDRNAGREVGFVLTGGNVDRDVFARVLAEDA